MTGAPKHAARVPFAVLVLGLLGGGMALLLLLNTASAANELRRHDLAGNDAGMAAQVQQLQIDVAASAAPDKLAEVAAALGMVPAMNPAFVMVAADGTLHVLGSPGAASAPPLAVPHRHPVPKTTIATTPTATTTTATATTTSRTSSRSPASGTSSKAPKGGRMTSTAARTSPPAKRTPPAAQTSTPSPTPTPTPTVTLPGGTR